MKKLVIGIVIVLLIAIGVLLFYVSGLEIGADVASDDATKSAIDQDPQETSLIFLDDSKTDVKPGEATTYNINVDFRTIVAEKLGVGDAADLSEATIKAEMSKIFDTESGDYFIQTSLINQATTAEADTPFYSSDHRININNFVNKNLMSFELNVPAVAPSSIQKGNVLVSKAYILKRVSTCTGSDARVQRLKCAYAKAVQGATTCEATCTYTWEKVAEATDTNLIDASANNVDLSVTSLETPETAFGYWKSSLPINQKINGTIENLGSDYAAAVKAVMKAPKGTISKDIPTDATLSEGSAPDGSKLDVLTWNFENLKSNGARSIKVNFTPEKIAVCTLKYNLTLTLSSSSTDSNESNNSRTISFRSNGCDWISALTGVK